MKLSKYAMATQGFFTQFNKTFLELAAALAILLLGLVLGRFLGKLVQRFFNQIEINKLLRQSNIKVPVEELFGSLVKYLVYIVSVVLALHQLGLTTRVLYALILIFILLLFAFIILAIKDFIPNVVAGIFVLRREHFKIGDIIKIQNIEGKILDITITEIKLQTKNKDILIIPNSVLQKTIVRKKIT